MSSHPPAANIRQRRLLKTEQERRNALPNIDISRQPYNDQMATERAVASRRPDIATCMVLFAAACCSVWKRDFAMIAMVVLVAVGEGCMSAFQPLCFLGEKMRKDVVRLIEEHIVLS